MSVSDIDTIDFASLDPQSGNFVLTIADHLNWDNPHEHLVLLQSKLNAYLRFIEGGEIYEHWPSALDRPLLFQVIGKYPLTEEADLFYRQASRAIAKAGFRLSFETLENDSS
ncbi:DUF6572 domain-containing protein [Aestuariivirga sp.]|uniref:DUF6572 domain-containing protein n=1 Tax=Aestuariivirga sp. TaxID=2650926 RepID=UPI003BAA570E